ncbi:MAG: biotin--[Clostridia bacterium]|nr:biotin--[acetyl-CoA-carboxylase] ligase [Clostridia bacterium]
MLQSEQNNKQQLCEGQIRSRLEEAHGNVKICTFAEIDSTNTEAKRMAASGFSGCALIAADRQSAGRGRMGRSFFSPSGTGAYFSILYTPHTSLSDTVTVTGAAAVAVMRAIRALTGIQTEIKWVNDLYLNGKKVCGILAESVCGERGTQVIVGIGINLCTEDFPAELCGIAGSLGADAVSPSQLIAETFLQLYPFLQNPHDRSWLEDYRTHSCVLGKAIRWYRNGVEYEGIAREIDDDGALIAKRTDGSIERLFTGEITIRIQ